MCSSASPTADGPVDAVADAVASALMDDVGDLSAVTIADPVARAAFERSALGLAEAVVACDRRVAVIHAERAVLIAGLHAAMSDLPGEWAREEIAVACRVSAGEARARLRTSLALERGLPETRRALSEGSIGWAHAVEIAGATELLTGSEARWVELEVLSDERARTPWQMGFRARKAALTVHPGTPGRPPPVVTDRSMLAFRGLGGEVCFSLTLPAPEAMVVQTYLHVAGVRQGADDARPGEVGRADAVLELFRGALDGGVLPSGGDGRRPHLELTAELGALSAGRYGLAEVEGRPVVGWHLRELTCEPDVRATTVDADGTVLDQGRTTRLVSARLRARLDVRDAHCRFPGCPARARRCRAHHIRHWADGGPTDLANLVLVCDRHHHAVHDGGWQVRLSGQTVHWTSLAGRLVLTTADLEQICDPDSEADLEDVDHWIRPIHEFFRTDPPDVPPPEPEPTTTSSVTWITGVSAPHDEPPPF